MKKTKKNRQGFLGQSRHFVRTAIFVAIFAVIGVYGLVLSHAATVPSVRFVLFCAQDKCSGDVSKIDFRGRQVRSWYRKQLGTGGTFRMLTTKKVVGKHNAAWYGSNAATVWGRIEQDGSLASSNVKTVAVLGWHAMDHCGVGGPPDLGVVDPFQGCGGIQNAVYAHELGHTFGLAAGSGADATNHRSDGSLMNAPTACNNRTLGHCTLNSSDRSYLLANRSAWFPTATASTADPDVIASDATSDQDIVPLYEYQSSGCADHIYSTVSASGTWAPEGNGCWYTYTGVAGYALQAADPAALPLRVYYNAGNHKHFYSTHPETACYGYPIEYCNYNYETTLAYTYTSQPYLTVKLQDFKNSGNNHVYTTHSSNACPYGAGGGGSDISVCGFSWFADVGFVYDSDPSN